MSVISNSDQTLTGTDLTDRKQQIINQIQESLPFKIQQTNAWQSTYWGKGVGAFQIHGLWLGQEPPVPAIVKIQGSRPQLSEPEIIALFNQQNQSQLIQAPQVLHWQPWDPQLQYELYVFRKYQAKFIVNPGQLATTSQLEEFFRLYQEYLLKAVTQPFLPRPQKVVTLQQHFDKWRQIRLSHPHKHWVTETEDKLLQTYADTLSQRLQSLPLRFQHAHLSIHDLKRSPSHYLIFSHLFWRWHLPVADSFFAAHWHVLGLAHLSVSTIKQQYKLWRKYSWQAVKHNSKLNQLYTSQLRYYHQLTVVERLLAALNLDLVMLHSHSQANKIKQALWPELKQAFLTLPS